MASGSNILENASIGYFESSSDTFPYEQGIVLTSMLVRTKQNLRNGIGQPELRVWFQEGQRIQMSMI